MSNISENEFNQYKKAGKVFPVTLLANGDQLTPISIFYNLEGKNKFLLESADAGRYSFIGCNPYMSIKSYGENVEVIKEGKVEKCKGKVLDYVKRFMDIDYYSKLSFPFTGGAVGYAGYDVIRQYERLPDNNIDQIGVPEAYFMFYKIFVCYDHLKHTLSIVYNVFPEDKVDYDTLEKELSLVNKKIQVNIMHELPKHYETELQSNFTEEKFCSVVDKAKKYIVKGDIFQVVLSQRLSAKINSKPFDVYRRLRTKNPSPYLFYIDFGDFQVAGSSPESLTSVFGDKVTTNPIAGTRPRGKNDAEDQAFKEDLFSDEKELAEHRMLLDLGRSDIGKVSQFGSVRVEKFMEIGIYSHVMHIVSTVSGKLREGLTCFDALASCLPAGTVSGAPKVRAMEIIDQLENVRRGIYAGAVGYFSYNKNMDTCIAIRTIVFKDGKAYIQAGGGIVYDSVPKNEYVESLNKARALREVL